MGSFPAREELNKKAGTAVPLEGLMLHRANRATLHIGKRRGSLAGCTNNAWGQDAVVQSITAPPYSSKEAALALHCSSQLQADHADTVSRAAGDLDHEGCHAQILPTCEHGNKEEERWSWCQQT